MTCPVNVSLSGGYPDGRTRRRAKNPPSLRRSEVYIRWFFRQYYRDPHLPRVPANPRVRDGELRGIHAVWAGSGPWVRADAGQARVVLPRDRVPAGSFLAPAAR
jgi:hypothetical protein